MKASFIGQDYLFVLDNGELRRLRDEQIETQISVSHSGGDLVRKVIFEFGEHDEVDGIKLTHLSEEGKIGWKGIKEVNVKVNQYGYNNLVKYERVGTRDGDSVIEIIVK